jgi:hypothetical protein
MCADLQRKILGVDPERVESKGFEDRVPLEPLESSVYVIARKREEVANVQPLRRRVRKHHQRVERTRAVARSVWFVPALPTVLPLSLDGGRIVHVWITGGLGDAFRSFQSVIVIAEFSGSPDELAS